MTQVETLEKVKGHYSKKERELIKINQVKSL